MVNAESKTLTDDHETKKSNKISVVLLTQNPIKPMFQHPHKVMSSMPREISKEIIVVHYNSRKKDGGFDQALESTHGEADDHVDQKILHVRVEGEFVSGVMKGMELSVGKYILVMDADLAYSSDVITKLVSSLIVNPNFIIVASRFVKDAHVRRIPFMQSASGKVARGIARYGLKIKNVKDPTSACFAFTRDLTKDIKFEGKGKEALLEILVKINTNNNNNHVVVKEIPIKQYDTVITRKLDLDRIVNYSKDVWELYRYGKKSKLAIDRQDSGQRTRNSVLFLSKAGRFFTVGASGLVINYLVSFLLAGVVSNIWYIQATFFGIVISITTNFLLNKIWTFEDRDFSARHFFRQYISFLGLCALGAVIQLSLVYVFVEYSHIQYGVSLIMAVCVASIGNFLLNKKITFGEKIWE